MAESGHVNVNLRFPDLGPPQEKAYKLALTVFLEPKRRERRSYTRNGTHEGL